MSRTSYLSLGVLLLACLVLGAWWLDVQNDQALRQEGQRRHWEYSVEPATIQDWMTFNYLNTVFALPPAYLQTALQIRDARYPYISIRQYAANHGVSPAAFLSEVQTALKARAASSTPAAP